MVRIAIADDDRDTQAFAVEALTAIGYKCSDYANGRDLITALSRDTFDLLLVDWNMPAQSGLDVIQWAKSNLQPCPPIIVFTSRSDKSDVVHALNSGADDYIVKPEVGSVIQARVNAALRRLQPAAEPERIATYGRFTFNRTHNSVQFDGQEVHLTAKEFGLAELLFRNSHRPLSRSYILQTIWNAAADLPTRTLDMHISRVRSKLALRPENGYMLQTVFGFGYRLEECKVGS